MRAAIVSLVGILVGLGGAPISASTEPLREYYESVSSLQGTFKQVTRDEQGQVVKRSKGQFSLKRPDRFHWFYETPFKQRLVSNGKWLYSHDVELLQVTIRPIEEVLGVGPAVVLSGDFQDLQASFRIREGEDGWYRLEPRDEDWQFQSVRLRLREGVPATVEVSDGLGQTMRLSLDELERNVSIPAERFRFEIPDDADVIAPDAFERRSR